MNRPIENRSRLSGLYVLTSSPRHLLLARAALRGGCRLIQLRDHETPRIEIAEIAREMRQITREFDALFFVCDHLALAREVDADGVHLEWLPLSLEAARQELGDGLLLSTGVSSVERAVAAQNAGADYLGVGPVFPTQTKKDAGAALGFETLAAVQAAVSIPMAAIGGLNATNIAQVPTEMASVVSALSNLSTEAEMESMTRTLIKELSRASE